MMDSVVIKRLEAFVFRHPIGVPVATSFGVMHNRPAVFVRIEDADGAFGWGEIFANWPAAGAEHRARLLELDIADLVLGVRFNAPGELFSKLEEETQIRAIQCGELGPFRQVIAGLDTAMWDLFARRAELPLRRLLDEQAPDSVPVYASGIAIHRAKGDVPESRSKGFRAFKVKVGFDLQDDVAGVREIANALEDGEELFCDANQAWGTGCATYFVDRLKDVSIGWLEEPLRVDAPDADWKQLADATSIPLAGGENIATVADFAGAIESGFLQVVQPDVAKWGGLTGCKEVASKVLNAGRRYCPHFLGGGLGLLASAHLLAAVGGDGLLEVDVNPNPLRDAFLPPGGGFNESKFSMSEAAGLGVERLPEEILPLKTLEIERHV